MNRLALQQNATGYCSSLWLDGVTLHVLIVLGRGAMTRDVKECRAFGATDRSHIRIAKSRDRFDKGLQHSLEIECRAADDLEHVGGGGLLLQRFAQLV
jgi:hypothetical protein